MMRSFVVLVVVAFCVTGCAMPTGSPLVGTVYTNVTGPVTATASDASMLKSGSATATSILGLIATGDASIETAAKNAGITKIHHVDYNFKSTLGLFSSYTVTVYGE